MTIRQLMKSLANQNGSYYGDKYILRPQYLHNGISYMAKKVFIISWPLGLALFSLISRNLRGNDCHSTPSYHSRCIYVEVRSIISQVCYVQYGWKCGCHNVFL